MSPIALIRITLCPGSRARLPEVFKPVKPDTIGPLSENFFDLLGLNERR